MFLSIWVKSLIFLIMLLHILWVIGATAEGVTGVLATDRVHMDLSGVSTIACTTAIGGGTLCDVVLGHHPLVWVASSQYLLVIAGAALITVLLAGFLMRHFRVVFLVADTISLSASFITGTCMAIEMGHGAIVAIVSAVLTGTFGSILHDLTCDRVPLVFQKELYASTAVIAATLYYALDMVGLDGNINITYAVLSALFTRLVALWRD